jgi:hypothetical protein
MVEPIHPITEPIARVRTVTPQALAAAYQHLFPVESGRNDPNTFAAAWLREYEAKPEACIGIGGAMPRQHEITMALLKALDLPFPNTTQMALFLLIHPDLEKQGSQIVYVSAKAPQTGENVDLIVRAVSREHAEIAWRDYFDGWDLPARPSAITPTPAAGAPGAIAWSELTTEAKEDAEDESESQIPSV